MRLVAVISGPDDLDEFIDLLNEIVCCGTELGVTALSVTGRHPRAGGCQIHRTCDGDVDFPWM